MEEYNVNYSNEALEDLKAIYYYILSVKQEPSNAKKLLDYIISSISSLSFLPLRNPITKIKSIEFRKMIVKNHIVFYSVDENNNTVFILRVLSSRQKISL